MSELQDPFADLVPFGPPRDPFADLVPPDAAPEAASQPAPADRSFGRMVGDAFFSGPIMGLLDAGAVQRGWEGLKHGFGDQPVGFSLENREKYPITTRTWQPFVAPIDTALRLPGAVIGGLAGVEAGVYRKHGGGDAEANRLERDLNILGQGVLIEPGMAPAPVRSLLQRDGYPNAEIGKVSREARNAAVKPAAGDDIAADPAAAPQPQGRPALASARPVGAAPRELPDLHEGARIAGDGPHGPIVHGYEGRWAEAVDWLRRAETGDARGVLSHPEVPEPIDVIWGDKDHGLAHIVARHPEVLPDLPERISRMQKVWEDNHRIRLQSPDQSEIAVLRTDYDGEHKVWLLSAYDRTARRGGETPESPPGLPGPTRSSTPPGNTNVGNPDSNNKAAAAHAPELPTPEQIADNRARVADFLNRVGVPPHVIGAAEIDAAARRIGTPPLPDAIETAALRNALESGVVTPDEVDRIYGPGAADAVRGTPTPANGQADPVQRRARGQSAPPAGQGQPVPRPGEGGEAGATPAANAGERETPTSRTGEPQTGDVRGPDGEPVRPADAAPDRPGEPRFAPGDDAGKSAGPEEAVRPDRVAPDIATARNETAAPSSDAETAGSVADRRTEMGNADTPDRLGQSEQQYSIGRRAARSVSDSLIGTKIAVPHPVFQWLGLPNAPFYANYTYLHGKHPDHFSGPAEVRRHVEAVLSNPEWAIEQRPSTPEQKALHVALIGRLDKDRLITFRAVLKSGVYDIRSAYVMGRGQLENMVSGARRAGATVLHQTHRGRVSPEPGSKGEFSRDDD
jgi:hypothetical protein